MELRNNWTMEKVVEVINKEFIGKSVQSKYSGTCLYRGYNNTKCVVGCFLSDKSYDYLASKKELGSDYDGIIECNPEIENEMPFDNGTMYRWQRVHDKLNPELSVEQQRKQLLDFIGA